MSEFISWSAIDMASMAPHLERLRSDWSGILNNSKVTERELLAFLRDNAGFFFHDSASCLVSIAELELGADLRPDFVVCTDRASLGFEYELIEIESPRTSALTKQGAASARLSTAIAQVQAWRHWIASHRSLAKKLFPSKSFVIYDEPRFTYSIVIGRRAAQQERVHARNQLAESLSVEIRSFDYLTDQLSKRRYHDTPLISSSQFNETEFHIKNALANPFFVALGSSVWRKFASHPNLESNHMVACNAKALLDIQTPSHRYNDYLKSWHQLDSKLKEELLNAARRWA